MAYLIDTNIAIHARDGTDAVLDKLAAHDTALRQIRLDILLRHIPVLPFDAAAAVAYGRIIAQCGRVQGRDYDRMIAAHAISTNSILVTDNGADFRDVPGLAIENWAVS